MGHDIIVIGAGIVGCSLARELSRYEVSVLVVDKEDDVSCGTSKANSGIAHAGFDAEPGTLKAKFNVEGNRLIKELAKELDFPVKENGALVLGFDEESLPKIEELYERGVKNGVPGLRIIHGEEIQSLEPGVSPEARHALYAPSSAIVSPYEMTIAYAENAAHNGVSFALGKEVRSIWKEGDRFLLEFADGSHEECSLLVNCAGVHADEIHAMVAGGDRPYHIIPRKGEYVLLDKMYGGMASHTLFQTPTRMGKGILVAPTTHGNLLVGPNAHDQGDKEDTDTSVEGLDEIWKKALLTMPSLPKRGIITQFAGLRAHAQETDDFIVGFDEKVLGLYEIAAIESPGLTSAPAIARHASSEIAKRMGLREKKGFDPVRKAIPRIAALSNEEREALIKENPLYGHIICRCEVVSEGEIVEAIRRVPGARDLDGIKRRTRAGMGRCQMGFCTPKAMEILARELKEDITDVTKKGRCSFLARKR